MLHFEQIYLPWQVRAGSISATPSDPALGQSKVLKKEFGFVNH